jgi:hypothetical protein
MTTRMAATAGMAATGKACAMFAASIVVGGAYVTSPVSRLIPLEMGKRLCSSCRHRSSISMVRIKSIINVAIEAVRTVKPWSGANEHASDKPIGPVVAVGRTVIRRVIEVPIRAIGLRSKVYAHADLSRRMSAHSEDETGEA